METDNGTVRPPAGQARNDHLTAWSAGLNFNRVAELLGVPDADLRYVDDAYVERRMSLLDGHARILLTQVNGDQHRLQSIIDTVRYRLARRDDQRRKAGERAAAMIAGRALMFINAIHAIDVAAAVEQHDLAELLGDREQNGPDRPRGHLEPAYAQDPRATLDQLSRCASA